MVELCEGLKIPWPLRLCGFKSRFEYEIKIAIIWMTAGCDFCFEAVASSLHKSCKIHSPFPTSHPTASPLHPL